MRQRIKTMLKTVQSASSATTAGRARLIRMHGLSRYSVAQRTAPSVCDAALVLLGSMLGTMTVPTTTSSVIA